MCRVMSAYFMINTSTLKRSILLTTFALRGHPKIMKHHTRRELGGHPNN